MTETEQPNEPTNEVATIPQGGGLLSFNSLGSSFPWDRKDNESEEQFGWFRVWVDLSEPRTFDRLARYTGADENDLRICARQFEWDYRVECYQDYRRVLLSEQFKDLLTSELLSSQNRISAILGDQLNKIATTIADDPESDVDAAIDRSAKLTLILQRLSKSAPTKRGAKSDGKGGTKIHLHFGETKPSEVPTVEVESSDIEDAEMGDD